MKASKSFVIPGAILTAAFISLVSLAMIISGTAPIAPKSHSILADMVKENDKLNTLYYQQLSSQIYISHNEYEILIAHWFKLISHAKKESGKDD